uniref:hemerythrin domain-containing protein n=1 Tax=Herbidospora sakaeratensis TaxID=564415 RepID=UPI0007834C6F|nr:hemerythrin domain-containing protein [Herbidospora sakaeratensis]
MSLLSELTFVHNMLRRDLATIRRMAETAAAGGDLAEVRQGLRDLATRGPLFQLKANCLSYCSIVHTHHGIESATLFPRIRVLAPELNAAVDRLEADHVAVSGLLEEVEAAARADDDRARLVKALDALADRFLEHLAYEEESLGAVLAQLTH